MQAMKLKYSEGEEGGKKPAWEQCRVSANKREILYDVQIKRRLMDLLLEPHISI